MKSIRSGELIRIYDFTGRQVLNTPVSGTQMDLNLTEEPNGVYIVQIHTPDAIWYRKVILIK